MSKLSLYREVKIEEVNEAINSSTFNISGLIENNELSIMFSRLMRYERHSEAMKLLDENVPHGYHYLVKRMKSYLDAKAMIESGETLYTDLIRVEEQQ